MSERLLTPEQYADAVRLAEIHQRDTTGWTSTFARALLDAEKELAALREDARRLDWLAENECAVMVDRGYGGYVVVSVWADDHTRYGSGSTARAAIDAARAQESSG